MAEFTFIQRKSFQQRLKTKALESAGEFDVVVLLYALPSLCIGCFQVFPLYKFSSIARIGGVASQIIEMIPKMCSEDSSIDCTKVPYAIYGILTIVGCVLMFGLPETKDEASPDNIDEGEVFGKVILHSLTLSTKKSSNNRVCWYK